MSDESHDVTGVGNQPGGQPELDEAQPQPQQPPQQLARLVKDQAARLGFDECGIAAAASPETLPHFQRWLQQGFHGRMGYLQNRSEAYQHPSGVLSVVRSLIVLATNYRTSDPQPATAGYGRVSRYAWGAADYHDTLRARMRALTDWLHQQQPGCRTRAVVDTAPLLERDLAQAAGLGWFGKNTMLLNKRLGSWFFLSVILTDLHLAADHPHIASHCGTCRRCLDECPTDAFTEAGTLDARKCISYLTIELRGQPIATTLRSQMEDWVFGCDVCQDVCPWNHKAPVSTDPVWQPADDLNPVSLIGLLEMEEDEFERRFANSPLLRPGAAAMRYNACLALGNSGHAEAVPHLIDRLDDHSPLVRSGAAWALGQLTTADRQQVLAALNSRTLRENNADVVLELNRALLAIAERKSHA